MTPFAFNTSPGIRFGDGISDDLCNIGGGLLGRNVLFVTDRGLGELGLTGNAIASLAAGGINVSVFDAVEADPSRATVMAASKAAIETNADAVIGFGGGSPMDVAKLAALLAGSSENLDEAWGVGNAKGPRLPLILVPTTAGTGSEVTPVSIITVGSDEKRGVVSPLILPDLAILDVNLTLDLPPHITAATGIDAMVHAIEAYTSKNPNNNPMSRMLAVEALKQLGANIEQAVNNGHNRDARSAMLLGSMLAGQAFANSPVAAVHALAYPLGGAFHVPHGLSNAMVLPHVLRFNAADPGCGAARQYGDLCCHAFPDMKPKPGTQASCAEFIERLSLLATSLGLETRMRQVGVAKTDLEKMANDAMKQSRLLVNNPREMTYRDALDIYRAAW